MSTFHWSFEQDLALWRDIGVRYAGLLISKNSGQSRREIFAATRAGIQSSTVIVNSSIFSIPITGARLAQPMPP